MPEYIVMLGLGILLAIIGILNRKGNISWLHSYHRKRVSEKDRIPFGKKVGLGTLICGISMGVCGIFTGISLYMNNSLLSLIGEGILLIGAVIGVPIVLYAIIKYNKGLF